MMHGVRQNGLMLLFALTFALLGGTQHTHAGPDDDLQAGIDAFNRGDLITAIASYRQAAEAGVADAQVRLAYILDYSEDNEEAAKWYRAAAEQGNADGQFGLGEMYAIGEGVEQNFATASEYIEMAAASGHLRAIRVLAKAYEDGGLGLGADPALAGQWWIRGAEIGDRDATRRVIAAYESGSLGLPANPERAAYWQSRLATEITNDE